MTDTPYLDRAMREFLGCATTIGNFGDERVWREYYQHDTFFGIDGNPFQAPKILTRKPAA